MNLLPIIERLRAECPEIAIEPPSQVLALDRQDYPAATVLLLGDDAEANATLPGVRQEVRARVRIAIAARMAVPELDSDPLEEARASVRAALLGYQARGWLGYAVRQTGELLEVRSDVALWSDVYEVRLLHTATVIKEI
jgi:hypothetical protein